MRSFTYTNPATIDELIMVLAENGSETRALAGGTDLLPLMKADIFAPEQLVNLKRLAGLSSIIEKTPTGMTLGALTTLSEIEHHPLIRQHYPALAEAASLAATPQLRNMATIGGNLLQRPRCWYFRNSLVDCWLKGSSECQAADGENQLHALFGGSPCVAVHPSDLAPVLVALGAELRLRSAEGERIMPLTDFFAVPEPERRTETVLKSDELLLEIRLPDLAGGMRSTYLKAMDRKVWAFALAGVAVALRLEAGRICDARVVLSGVAPIPWRAMPAEQLLNGATPCTELFEQAADSALRGAVPLAQNGYKIQLVRALLQRALAALTQE